MLFSNEEVSYSYPKVCKIHIRRQFFSYNETYYIFFIQGNGLVTQGKIFIHIQGFETPLKSPSRRARLWRLYKTHIPCELFVTHGVGHSIHSYLYQKVPLLTLVLNPSFFLLKDRFCMVLVQKSSKKMFMWFISTPGVGNNYFVLKKC